MGSIANRMRIERELNGLSRKQAARLTGMGEETLRKIETDEDYHPSFDMISRLARLYNSSLDDIAFGYDDGYDD